MSSASVLIVDDDRSIVRLCQRLLERASYEVYASTDPLEALKILEATKLDLLLADIRMPVMDGFELIERARNINPDLAVLVMTGFGTVDTAVQALYKGVDGLILKPFENTADLVQAVQRVLVDSRQKQEAARAQALRPLFDLSETLISETSLQSLEKLVLDAIVNTFQAQYVCVLIVPSGSDEPKWIISKDIPDPVGSPAWGHVLRFAVRQQSGELLSISGPGDSSMQSALRMLGWSAMLVTPIQRSDQKFIFIAGRETKMRGFGASELELFTILARQSVVAMENARLYTDLKEYVKKVEDSQRALIQAEKMAAVGRLMASLAHEINNPLQSVRNCVHLAMRSEIADGQRSSYLSMTETEVERLVNTVRHMLDFYRPGTTEKESVNMNGVIERVVHLLQSQMKNTDIHLTLNLPQEPLFTFGERDQLQQVVFNILLNGMDALENHASRSLWVDMFRRGQDVHVVIEDSGSGIAAELHERLFEPFFSTKKYGTGLGLSISYSIIEAHNGNLSLIPGSHGQGACFDICLPIENKGTYSARG